MRSRVSSQAVLALALAALAAQSLAQPLPGLERAAALETDLKFDDLFPRRSFYGTTPSPQGWSPDDRYLVYLWNPLETPGRDIYLYDARRNETRRLTSKDLFARFDEDIPEMRKTHDEDQERRKRWDTLSDAEWRAERQKLREENEKRREPLRRYPGVSTVTWANNSNEFLFTYRGDIFRWRIGNDLPTRLTDTRENETNVEYLPDDKGFVFQRGSAVFRMRFDSANIVQLSPVLTDGVQFSGFRISPQADQMLVFGFRTNAPARQVDYIVYRDRFAQARKTDRGVAEDDFNTSSFLYLVDIREESIADKSKKREPLEIWKWPGGEEWQETSIAEKPWSPDGTRFTFGSWARDKKELKILEVDLAKREIKPIFQGTSDGEHRTPSLARPFYTHDGESIVALLDKSGWRHLHLLDRKGGERQITSGNFEVYPLRRASQNGKILVASSKQHLARRDIFRVNLANADMERLSRADGRYDDPAFQHKSDRFATVHRSWSQLPELFLNTGAAEARLTDSHRTEAFWNVVNVKPQLFTYTNRHGDEVHAYKMLPADMRPGEKRPLFIYVYGGPLGTGKSVEDGSFNTTAYLFAMYLTRVLGYVTVTVDPRGSSGYSARFGRANWENIGVPQTEDITDLVNFMAEKHNIDRQKVGLNGWSFGGWQTQHTMYTAPGVVTLGIAGAGPTEWQNYNTWYSGGVVANAPKGKPEELDRFSLTHVAKNLQDPLLLLHGVEDTNVLFQDTVKVYRRLLQAGKGGIVELSIDPTGGHGMGGDMDTRDRHAIYLAFILRHWGAPTRTPN